MRGPVARAALIASEGRSRASRSGWLRGGCLQGLVCSGRKGKGTAAAGRSQAAAPKPRVARLFLVHEGKYGCPRPRDLKEAGWKRARDTSGADARAGWQARPPKRKRSGTNPAGRGRAGRRAHRPCCSGASPANKINKPWYGDGHRDRRARASCTWPGP